MGGIGKSDILLSLPLHKGHFPKVVGQTRIQDHFAPRDPFLESWVADMRKRVIPAAQRIGLHPLIHLPPDVRGLLR
jgi:hypothetical protein